MTLTGKRVLYISYNGMLEPLGQSQVLPYLRALADQGVRFTLLSFERSSAFEPDGRLECEDLKQSLAARAIEWHWLPYHQSPSLPATVYDVLAGIRLAQKLVRRNAIEMVHARSHIPATIGMTLKRRLGVKFIFDLRGLMAEEYVDAAHWSEESLPFRLTKSTERRILKHADAIVTLTRNIWPIISEWEGLRDRKVVHEVVPCCVDLELFKFSEDEHQRRRTELGLQNSRVLVYSGSIGGWYQTDKMADLFVTLTQQNRCWHFLWLTTGDAGLIIRLMTERGVGSEKFTVRKAAPGEVQSYLSAADAAIAFYKPTLSRVATSPVKVSEYLACGLPVIINAGIGDSDELVTRHCVGALVRDFSESEYINAAAIIERCTANVVLTRQRSREVAEALFDVRRLGVERYARLYERVLTDSNEPR